MRRLRVPLVGVVVHGRRWRTYEYRSARVFEQVLQQRHFDGRSAAASAATAATGGPAVVVVVVVVVVVPAVVVLLLVVVVVVVPRLLRMLLLQWQWRLGLLLLLLLQWRLELLLLLLRGHRTLARRTVGQIVGYELFRFRVHVCRPPDAYPRVVSGRRVLRCLRRPLVLVPFQYRLGPPMRFRRPVYRFSRHRRRGLAAFPCKNQSNCNDT